MVGGGGGWLRENIVSGFSLGQAKKNCTIQGLGADALRWCCRHVQQKSPLKSMEGQVTEFVSTWGE